MKKWKPNLASIDTFGARESTRPHRSYVDNEYQEKGYMSLFPHSTTAIYLALGKFANNTTQVCYPSSETLMGLVGMKNRNTFFRDIKLLIHYRIVRKISGAKGRVPNVYQLLSHTLWKEINSNDFDTVKKSLSPQITVSKNQVQPYQKSPLNSNLSDTGNQISNSDKKVTSNYSIKGKLILKRLLPSTASIASLYFKEDDVITTLEKMEINDNSVLIDTKTLLKALKKLDCTPLKKLPTWLKYD